MKTIKNLNQACDGFIYLVRAIIAFLHKNRPADRALSSRARTIAVRAWSVF